MAYCTQIQVNHSELSKHHLKNYDDEYKEFSARGPSSLRQYIGW